MGVEKDGRMVTPKLGVLPKWRPPTVPFDVFVWLLAQLSKFVCGVHAFKENSDEHLLDGITRFAYASLCQLVPGTHEWRDARLSREKSLSFERKGTDLSGDPIILQCPPTEQWMYGEYMRFVSGDEDSDVELLQFPADYSIWSQPGAETARWTRNDILGIGQRPEDSAAACYLTEAVTDDGPAERSAPLYYIMPPCPDTIINAVKGTTFLLLMC